MPVISSSAPPATCHPRRPRFARGLCVACYNHHRDHGTLDQFPRIRRRATEFVADYELLRSEGYGRTHIAERLGMTRNAVDLAYSRAVRAGLLTPDRRAA